MSVAGNVPGGADGDTRAAGSGPATAANPADSPPRPLVRLERHGAVAVIVIDNPPVNALSPGVGDGIVASLEAAQADPGVEAIVLIGAGRSFIAGADIRNFGKGIVRPGIGERPSDRLDAATKPVVAAIHGHALGGGLEYALSCHYRIAKVGARLGLPEVAIGALPGGGGTQRLPRLIGVQAALDMIVSGRHVPAAEAHALGLVDALVAADADLQNEAVAFARRIAPQRPLPRASTREDKLAAARAAPGMFDAKRTAIAREARNRVAPFRCIDAVEASVQRPFAEGLRYEFELFEALENTDEARGLRYAFFAEREAAKVPGLPQDAAVDPIGGVAIVGAGTMGVGIAMACADAGLPVRWLDADAGALQRGLDRVRENYAGGVARGRLDAATMAERLARIVAASRYRELAACNVAVEAVFESLPAKHEVFRALDAALPPGSLLLTNTSGIDVEAIAAVVRDPGQVAGAHFFSPANVMKLLEVVRTSATSPAALAATLAFGKRLSKINVTVRNGEGFMTSRSRTPFTTEMVVLLEEGALPEEVDRVMVEFGYPMGPFAVGDLAGLDISRAWRERRATRDPYYRALPIADRLVDLGRLGQKAGRGWYRYEPGSRVPQPDAEVAQIIADFVMASGRPSRRHSDAEILHRLLFASVNECCRIVEEGGVLRASDIDVAWVHGFGFPRYRGGPMFWADGVGAQRVLDQVEAWSRELGPRWTPAPLLRDVARRGGALRQLAATA